MEQIVDCADLAGHETVLEIGPGLGTMTSVLLGRAQAVTAVEFDRELADKLPAQFPGKNLTVVHHDILSFDTSSLPDDYVVVGNIPYYITNKIIRKFCENAHRPKWMVLLVQKEVAERLAAKPGNMSVMAVAAQIFYEVDLGIVVPACMFTPPPKVDSQVATFMRRGEPQVSPEQQKTFFRLLHAGFSEKRKKLRSSLAGGLAIPKHEAERALTESNISPDARAQELSIEDWLRLVKKI